MLEEHFTDPEALERFTLVDGARTGDGPASSARIENAALVLEANPSRAHTSRTRTCSSSFPAARCSRFASSSEASRGRPSCDGSPRRTAWIDDIVVESVSPPKVEESRTAHFEYRLIENSHHDQRHIDFNEESYRQVSTFFGVMRTQPIVFVQYPDTKSKEEYTGTIGNAVTLGDEIHTIWPTDRHEIVHVLGRVWGNPPALIAEGLDSEAFRRGDDLATYAIAGAFVGWIIKHAGVGKLHDVYSKLRLGSSARENAQLLTAILGRTAEEAERELRAELPSLSE